MGDAVILGKYNLPHPSSVVFNLLVTPYSRFFFFQMLTFEMLTFCIPAEISVFHLL